MKKKILNMLLIIMSICLLVACKQGQEVNLLLPPEDEEGVICKPSSVIYQNPRSTSHSIRGPGSIFTFSKDMMVVEDGEEILNLEISFDEIELTIASFQKQFQETDKVPDISSYNNILQYDLCESTNELPGYRLYILDDQYWIGTIYKSSVWRIVSLDMDK